jgi:cysteinyl-tRNA synthetase
MEDGASEGGGIADGEQFSAEKKGPRDFALWKAYKVQCRSPQFGSEVFA